MPTAAHPLSALLTGPGLRPPPGSLCLRLLLLRTVVLNDRVILTPTLPSGGRKAMARDIFGCHNLGVAGKGGCHRPLVCRGQGWLLDKLPLTGQPPPQQMVPNINRATFERPWPRRIVPSSLPSLRSPLKCRLLRKTFAPAPSASPPPPRYWPRVGFPSLSFRELWSICCWVTPCPSAPLESQLRMTLFHSSLNTHSPRCSTLKK